MREVTTAKSAGFCFGVRRAVDMVYAEAKKDNRVFTLGPIIHNEQVVKDLEKKGVKVIDSVNDISEKENTTIIIRSHGVPQNVINALKEKKVNIVDATCPFVSKIHRFVEKKYQEGSCIVIVGNANHPEVEGINGWCNGAATVIGSVSEAENYSQEPARKLCVVAQTTYNFNKFQYLVEIFQKNSYDKIDVLNTICSATEERQKEAAAIAAESDAMIVIGSRNSSNACKLYDICRERCAHTYFIRTAADMDFEELKKFDRIGITAGASTPQNIIEEVQAKCQI